MDCITQNYATPMNTLGMGNAGPETDPCVPVCKQKKKKLKSLKQFIKAHINKNGNT